MIVLYQHSASVLRGRHEAGSDFVWCTCARAIVRRGTARSGRRQFRGSSEGSLRELCSGLRHRVRRRSITLPRRPLCTFQAATGREAAPCGMATVGTGRAFKCATDRVTPSEQREQPASAGCFLLGENHRGLPKCGADSVSASALKGVLRSCGTNVPRVCYFHNMRRRQCADWRSAMPQAQSLSQHSFFRHLICPSCLTPMHVRLAEVAGGKRTNSIRLLPLRHGGGAEYPE